MNMRPDRWLWAMLFVAAAGGYLLGSGAMNWPGGEATQAQSRAEAQQPEPAQPGGDAQREQRTEAEIAERAAALTDDAQADFTDDESRTIALFETARDSVVNINAVGRRVDLFTRRVREVPRGVGSGFFWDDRGHIVTNYHVIQNASGARVVLADQTTLEAELVGVSPDHDLAVLKVGVDDGQGKPLPLGASAGLRVGQFVYAIGNPFGLDYTLTRGIVSALDREITAVTGRPISEAIQTDAAINPGNSGGPLLDSHGRLIGVNTMIFSPSGASAGIGFAVPIDTIARVVPQLIETGRYTPPTLGIRISDRASAQLLRGTGIEGVLVLTLEEGGPAEQAGLRPTRRARDGSIILGDIIIAIDGEPVTNATDVYLILDRHASGDTVTVIVRRGENAADTAEVEVTLQ